MEHDRVEQARRALVRGIGRRGFLQAAAALGLAGATVPALAGSAAAASGHERTRPGRTRVEVPREALQPGKGRIPGRHYLPSAVDDVRWGYVPSVGSDAVLHMRSGETVTIDTVSHEGILEDQGRDPSAWFAERGVARQDVLDDAVEIARDYDRTPRSFDVDGPHVVTGPVHVEGARPGDVLKIESLVVSLRVPYGVVSSRHGKGALPQTATGGAPDGITLEEVMPPVETDGRSTGDPEQYGNVSVFTPVRRGPRGSASGVMPAGAGREAVFPLNPFMGLMGVAFADAESPTAPELNSIPPTLGGGNIDINLLGTGSAFYVPVVAEGALFHVGDPHMAMGDGEVALTAMEGSLRAT